MPTKPLSESANLEHLKKQAKDLRRAFQDGQMSALQRIREFHPKFSGMSDADISSAKFTVADAQLSIAREYAYGSWPRLKAVLAEKKHVEAQLPQHERLAPGPFREALHYIDTGNANALKAHLAAHPNLVHEQAHFEGGNYFTKPTLLEFIPENPMRQHKMPANAVEIARIVLEAGAKDNQHALNETLMLAGSGQVCRECGLEEPLIRLLCEYGADPAYAMNATLVHVELAAAHILIDCGAPMDLVAAATLGEKEAVVKLLPQASEEELQLALSLSANAGQSEIVTMIINAGADPSRYNPPSGHSHCTPLHSAVAMGHYETSVALVEGGADPSIKDIHHNMTPLQWAEYLKKQDIVDYLRKV